MKGRGGGAVERIRGRGRIGSGGLIMIDGRRMRRTMREKEEEVEGKKVKRGSEGKMERRRGKREKEKEGIGCWRNKERGKKMRGRGEAG